MTYGRTGTAVQLYGLVLNLDRLESDVRLLNLGVTAVVHAE
eukprot:SAG11_NODE_2293_length_3556_cov_4.223315_3_plen_41_part_00